ncbi:type 1 glutamine amidotransferase domain-containing protein [Nocardia terpenica]|uniref:Protease n=1 Tax=Nocardia terpenica TaxID=455432 RepID=A0A164PKL1_9NOCA|nr:type 1 glutamine amidotransferase domain-containing protein [Nocardia terpenica]KZM75693.1 protease [Nocardia terpenica]NQE86199.1 type 1 glutamine amidotransferase [Nocardia terpenica]
MSNPREALFIVSDLGVERDELLVPTERLAAAGIGVTVASPSGGKIQTYLNDTDRDVVERADAALDNLTLADFDVLVIPGGTLNVDQLRCNRHAVEAVKAFVAASKPIASMCHGPWVLVEANVLPGKTLTSYHTVRTDLINAGGDWIDEPVVVSSTNGWTLITSRQPTDLDAFTAAIIDHLGH